MQSKQRGFSLLEVMVAGAVTSTGLAALAGLMLGSVVDTRQAEDRLSASRWAGQLAAAIHMSPGAGSAWLAPPPAIVVSCAAPGDCTPGQFAAQALQSWQVGLASELAGGQGRVCRDATPDDGTHGAPACDGAGPLTLKIFWLDDPATPSPIHRFTLSVSR